VKANLASEPVRPAVRTPSCWDLEQPGARVTLSYGMTLIVQFITLCLKLMTLILNFH
jgi:hypothetical protein